jgi:peptidoglycan hydrolase-like protein with peptidoglycan-binding domain
MAGSVFLSVLLAGVVAAAPPGIQEEKDKPDETIAEQSEMILGLDGVAYRPYKKSLIEWVQKKLRGLDLYDGEVQGKLDEKTMKAIAEFQKEHDIHASGIPSPLTRKALKKSMGSGDREDPGVDETS